MVYATYNRGFKSGGYNIASPNVAPFRPETLDDWEAGLKSELFDRRLTFNVNGFLYKYRNMQVIFFPTGGVAGARPVIANAAKSTDRKSVVSGKRVSIRVYLGGHRTLKKKRQQITVK